METATVAGSRDGLGASDHDQPYRFGVQPSYRWTYPFDCWQYARLLILRGRIQDLGRRGGNYRAQGELTFPIPEKVV